MKFIQAKNYTKSNRSHIRLIIIHDMEYPELPTGAEWCANFFAGENAPKASAHYCIDNDSIVQCVRDEDVAWHAPGANSDGIGIEHAGYARQTPEQWMDDYSIAALELSAGLVAKLCEKYDIPPRRLSAEELAGGAKGIAGHADITKWTGKGTHWDPGPGFPWEWYLDRVNEHMVANGVNPPVTMRTVELTGLSIPEWQEVELDGQKWQVAPNYVGPVAIGSAEELAKSNGCELPTPALVDAIWAAADLKIDARDMVRNDHDFTMVTMASRAIFDKQADRIAAFVKGKPYKLLAGTHKDVVQSMGKVGIYGWHDINGKVIQPFYSKHVRGWIDYSQGLRLVRRA